MSDKVDILIGENCEGYELAYDTYYLENIYKNKSYNYVVTSDIDEFIKITVESQPKIIIVNSKFLANRNMATILNESIAGYGSKLIFFSDFAREFQKDIERESLIISELHIAHRTHKKIEFDNNIVKERFCTTGNSVELENIVLDYLKTFSD